MRTCWITIVLALAACSDGEKEDADGDGALPPFDCDDNDPDIGPEIAEVCDGIDNNCDTVVDEGLATRYWTDADGDGAGDQNAPVDACQPPAGAVENSDDCDDGRADVNPSAPEDCDPNVDRNCDGDAVADAADEPTWYRDADDDTFGRDDITLTDCVQPSGYAPAGGDCDDNEEAVFPGAPETCNEVDDDCNSMVDDSPSDAISQYADTDLDGFGDAGNSVFGCPGQAGYTLDDTDCDDTAANVNPGETEVCNGGVDDDCDPTTDEDVLDGTPWYQDGDSDTYGTATIVTACTQPPNTATRAGDCDDLDPTINPGADELCGGDDEDCSGAFDDNPADGTAYHPDNDLDGYGSAANTVLSCANVPGYVLDGTDCNDLSASSHPGAPEQCDGGVDNDCDATTSDDDSPTAPTFYADTDGDGHGDPGAPVQACTQPGGTSGLGDDCDDAVATTYPGANDLCDGGVDNDCDPATNEAFTSLWYRDADGDGWGNDAITYQGCSPPVDYVQLAGDCDDTDPSLNPDLTPGCIETHCGVEALSTTWKNTVEHLVTCDVDVRGAGRPLLTIEDGAIVRFVAGVELSVGEGGLGEIDVQGDVLGVTFTSNELFPIEGDWDGLWIGDQDQGSSIVGLTVEYAGLNGYGGVFVQGGSPRIERLTSRNNLNSGLFVDGSEPLVLDSTFVENTAEGVYVDTGAGLSRIDESGTFGPSFTGNVIMDNRDRPIVLPGSHADEIDLSNTLVPNDTEEIGLLSGTMRFAGTWYDHGIPYVVADGATIDVEDGPAVELFVEDGVEVYFGTDSDLNIGDGAGGRIEIVDGPTGVLMGPTLAVILASDNWNGLKIGADDTGSILRNLTIEYGGGNGNGNVWIQDSAPLLDNVVSRYSDSNGVYVTGFTSAPEIRNSSILDNDENGVYVSATSGLARSLAGPTFANNVVTGNGLASVVLPPNFVGELDPSTSFTGNVFMVQIHGGDAVEEATWRKLDEDYQVLDDIDIGGPQDPEITIQDAVTMWFDRDTTLTVGVADDGALLIDADPGSEVTFTSNDPAPGDGDWYGLQVGKNGQLSSQTTIRGLVIEYAGGSDPFGVGGSLELVDVDTCTDGYEPEQVFSYITFHESSKSCFYAERTTGFYADYLFCQGANDACWNVEPRTPTCEAPTVYSFTNNVCVDGLWCAFSWPANALHWYDPVYDNSCQNEVIVSDTLLFEDSRVPNTPGGIRFIDVLNVGSAGDAVLTIDPGAVVDFGPGAGLEIGGTDPGGLVIGAGAVLQSYAGAAAAPGDWAGVTLGRDCSTVNLQNATITHGGGNAVANLFVDDCDNGAAVISNMAFDYSSSCGLFLDATDTPLTTQSGSTYVGNIGSNLCP